MVRLKHIAFICRIFLRGLHVKIGAGVALSLFLAHPLFSLDWRSQHNVEEKPNIILIFCDDLGYGDIEPFGAQQHQTPNLVRMANEGIKLTDFYVASGVCTPSRASIMTGSYPRRVDMHVNAVPPGTSTMRQVLFAVAHKGLHPEEETIADILKNEGYSTAMVGKWHLGDQSEVLPTRQGFDSYFGIPYSNDMGAGQFEGNPPLPLIIDETVLEAPVDQDLLTKRYTEESLKFISNTKNKPFFLYLAHNMPHNPVHASDQFKGTSRNNTYGDAVQEIDWSVGKILDRLDSLGLSENTLVIFTSDNGAAPRFGGINSPLTGYKGSTDEGGMRVPALFRWKGMIPEGATSNELVTSMDILPTVAALAKAKLPSKPIDGQNVWDILIQKAGATTPHKAFYYYQVDQLQAVRSGDWKLFLPLENKKLFVHNDERGSVEARLYNLSTDMREMNNLAKIHPEVVEELIKLAQKARAELGDGNVMGSGQRKALYIQSPVPQLKMENK